MVESAPTQESRDWSWLGGARGWLKAAASTATALGLVTYAVLRADYAIFYGRFGLKPEDVGLGQAELISQSLFGVVFLLALLAVELLLFVVMLRFVGAVVSLQWREMRDTARQHGIVTTSLIWAVPVVAVLGVVLGGTPAGPWVLLAVGPIAVWWLAWRAGWRGMEGATRNGPLIGLGLLVFALSLAWGISRLLTIALFLGASAFAVLAERLARRKERRNHSHPGIDTTGAPTNTADTPDYSSPPDNDANPSDVATGAPTNQAPTPADSSPPLEEPVPPKSSGRWLRASSAFLRRATAVIALVTVVFAEIILASQAGSDADMVRSGHTVQPTLLGIPLASWGAQYVLLAWTGDAPQGLEGIDEHCLLYLGQGSRGVFLYDHDSNMTINVPSGAVALSIVQTEPYQLVCE